MIARIARVYCDDDPKPDDTVEPLLVPRKDSKRVLNCGSSQIHDLEVKGRLTQIRLGNSAVGKVYHQLWELKAIARGER